jgi:hypothetical protein
MRRSDDFALAQPREPLPKCERIACYGAQNIVGFHAHDVLGAAIPICSSGYIACDRQDFHIHSEDVMDTKQIQIDANKKIVNHPAHYGGDTTYETVKVIAAWGLGFLLGNAVKYISRAGKKDPSRLVEDLKKGRWYLDKAIEHLERGEPLF